MDAAANSSLGLECVFSDLTRGLFAVSALAYLLFLPVFLFVLYIAFNKWKKPQSSASGGLSHSDVFTLHMVAMEMLSIIGACGFCYMLIGLHLKIIPPEAYNIFTVIYTGQMLFHGLTCVERYLAVVHPVTYLSLRGEGGVTVRNISIALVWVTSIFFCLIGLLHTEIRKVYCFSVILLVVPLVTYCSVYVLRVLTRPKPGDGGGHRNRKQIDQSKRATVYTMTAILGVLLMRLAVTVIYFCLELAIYEMIDVCMMAVATNLFCLPSGLVLPLLFLHRNAKLSGKI